MSKSKGKTKGKMIKVPKRVAGVKIPKAVRKGPVLEFVNSSAGKLLVAEAITAALGAVAYRESKASAEIKGRVGDAEEALKQSASRLTHAFAQGVRAFREALAEEAPGEWVSTDEDGPALPKKSYRKSSPAASSPG